MRRGPSQLQLDQNDRERAALVDKIARCQLAADGDSNDEHIAALADALYAACDLLGVDCDGVG